MMKMKQHCLQVIAKWLLFQRSFLIYIKKTFLCYFSAIDIRNWDVWDMTLNLLNNSHRFQSADLAEKGVLVLFESLIWEIKRLITDNETNEVSFFL